MDFFSTGRLLKQVNTTLITLIPKVCAPSKVADFRPISCCNVIYKILTKILVLRFRGVLEKIISPSQNVFVPCRSISDNILLAQELFSGYNQSRLPPRCALKVDLRKVYDTVEWDFLMATLQLFGFPPKFIGWIEECVTSPSFSLHLNGGIHGFFAGARGLRQGDRCPYLFVLVIEEGRLPLRYLGLPLISSRLTKLDCQPLVQKIEARIKGWEGVGLSFAGRVQLVKSVLLAFEVYWAMAFLLPKGIIKEIVSRIRAFLWKGNSTSGYPKEDSIWDDWIGHYRLRGASIWTVNAKCGVLGLEEDA
ncbi:UNVERIFIED_CONTAM: hypothetical protein Scaly_3042000 [Sesamum calycinum]|uniref:Reverse transcriptase domain-containing protein n=1 Tax=Sesamum calycinum TaxID=2727403 RepID=A0AAW2K7U7_9LAMI